MPSVMRRLLIIAALATSAVSLLAQDDLLGGSWKLTTFDRSTRLTRAADGSLTFPFPDASSGNAVTRLLTDRRGPLLGSSLTVTARVETTGTPQFLAAPEPGNTCEAPATARPYVERRGWDTGKLQWDANQEYYRWWSNPVAIVLGSGTTTITVPLSPDAWSSVYGKFGTDNPTATAEFSNTLQDVGRIGLSFGAGCFFGHGVNVSGGTAIFALTVFQVS